MQQNDFTLKKVKYMCACSKMILHLKKVKYITARNVKNLGTESLITF